MYPPRAPVVIIFCLIITNKKTLGQAFLSHFFRNHLRTLSPNALCSYQEQHEFQV